MIFTGLKFKTYRLWKKVSSKSCREFNFQQKTQWALASISCQSGARGLESFPCLKYNVLKWENRFTYGLEAAKNSDYMKEKLEVKFVENSIPYKKLGGCACLSPRLPCLKYYRVLRIEFSTIFIWSFSSYNQYFLQPWAWKSIWFPISVL